MAYGDRLTLKIKDFGRKVEISVRRGKIVPQGDTKATITYQDSPVRNVPRGKKSIKPRKR